mmetsp:Transcript_119060/g.210542  ORF Transcript_119060/g.210542 Transcript_119060/m.210542 type:complete len:127 (+) Transcript_119060:198-578(+)
MCAHHLHRPNGELVVVAFPSYITLFSIWLIMGKSMKLIPFAMPTWTHRGSAPEKNDEGPSFFSIFMKQSDVLEYNSLAASPCIRDLTQSCGWVSNTEPQPARNPAPPFNSGFIFFASSPMQMICMI